MGIICCYFFFIEITAFINNFEYKLKVFVQTFDCDWLMTEKSVKKESRPFYYCILARMENMAN